MKIGATVFEGSMGKKFKNLYEQICDPDNLWAAYARASNGKRESAGYLNFRNYESAHIAILSQKLADKTYQPGRLNHFTVFEPKPRVISALPFKDRVVQHSLHAAIEPAFERSFLPNSFACRDGKGTHVGVKKVQSMLRRLSINGDVYCLKMDFSKYFPSIDREVLYKEVKRKISCKDTLELLAKFHPSTGKGIPIGNLTSQLLANIYGNKFDHFLVHKLGIKNWARYMDDTIILSNSKDQLRDWFIEIHHFIEQEMKMKFSKWSIQPASRGVNFLGYRIWSTHKLLRKASVTSAKRKLKKYANDPEKKERFLASWLGHASHANSYNLLKRLGVINEIEASNQHQARS